MAKIIPKLNLNRTPQAIDNYSLVAAKNIKLNKDNSFSRDIGIANIDIDPGFVGCISHNTKLYLFYSVTTSDGQNDYIKEYDETTGNSTLINSAWHYSGGIIDGKVVVNLRGETLLIINEYFDETNPEIKVPIKTINLNDCSKDDDESIYTQTPKLQLFDLIHVGDYTEPIQAGVYTFFARYEIKDGFYTNWFPVSKPLYAGQKKLVHTIQGSIEYVDENVNCGVSFVFKINRPIIEPAVSTYKYLQIGFILSRENEEVARTWKKFPVNVDTIYFDNNKHYIKEIDINEFLKPIYNNYNVKNLVNFKHKSYISNYEETNADIDLTHLSSKFNVKIVNENLKELTYKEYNGALATTERISVITNNPDEDDATDNPYVPQDINVITKLDNVAIPQAFYNYYINSSGSFNNVITSGGFLSIGSYDSLHDSFDNLPFQWQATNMGSYYSALASCLGQLFGVHDKSIIEYVANTDYANYFPPRYSNIHTGAYVDAFKPNTLTQDTQYGKAWYINEAIIYIPNEDPLDLIKIYKNIQSEADINNYRCTVNAGGYVGCYTNDINKTILDILKEYIYGITDNNEVILRIPVIENDTTTYKYYNYDISTIGISYTCLDIKYYFKPGRDQAGNQWGYDCYLSILDCYWRYQKLNLKPNNNLFNNLTSLLKTNVTTLIPEQTYHFYVHFIKNTGEITNGYFVDTKTINAAENIDAIKTHNVFYPSIINNLDDVDKNELRQLGYNCYFITAVKNNTIIECTDQQCLEFDLLLNRSDKVTVTTITEYGDLIEETGYYMDDTGNAFVADNKTENLSYFGSGGYLVYENSHEPYSFIKNLYDLYEKQLNLTKVTPYTNINDSINKSHSYFNCFGFLVYYRKPTKEDLTRYISGGTVFEKSVKNQVIQLDEIKESIPIVATLEKTIYSNYNLNFLRLTVSLQEQIRMYEVDENTNKREFTKFVNSLNLKDLYGLSSSYKDYTTYLYTNHNPINSKYIFDNIIRGSQLIGDEANNYIVTFNALDYYNVPTNKGIVIKLAGIGDTMLVHTQDSIFEFSGKPSIASDSAAQIVETDIFDSGITEVIPSEYGMAGLQHKDHAIVTPFGYVFWDAQINTIYYYAGKGQLAPISDPIRKLLDSINPTTARFSYDYVNDRFFINVINTIGHQQVTLSYNVKAKAFVSFHDFNYNYSVNTKNKTYYIKSIARDKVLGVLSATAKSYASFYNPSNYIIHTNDEKDHIYSYVDVIVNDNYEKIKTLDSVSWICGSVKELSSTINETVNVAEDVSTQPYPGNKMVIYSDTCSSGVIPIHNENLKTIQDYTKGNYKAPVYNLGKFNLNYFRNVNLGTNIEQTLIYGKYFCIRLFFDVNANTEEFDDFKLENIELLYTLENYGKI